MCGIFGYTGKREALPLLLKGLTTLEYRGYDSAGVYVMGEKAPIKATGAVSNLKEKITLLKDMRGVSGISHTRWATHGEPTEANAHPHVSCSGEFVLIHNGIIENYREIKEELIKLGHTFLSQTDSEVVAHLIEEKYKSSRSFEDAARASIQGLRGTYGLAIMYAGEPDTIIIARMGSPIALGIGEGETFVASDSSPILEHTKRIVYLDDGEMAIITPDTYSIQTLEAKHIERIPELIEWDPLLAQKGGHDHFMMKEILEAPQVVRNAIRGRLLPEEGRAVLGGLKDVEDTLKDIERLLIVGCGTAFYSGLVGEYMLEEYAHLPVEVDIASEFRYRKPIVPKNTVVLAISQSGETIDTLSALREAKGKGALALGIVNVVGSTIARETNAGVYNHAGPEIGVASTKAFISQLSVLVLLTLFLGRERGMSKVTGQKIAQELLALPDKMQKILDAREKIKSVAEKYLSYKDFLYLGRKYSYPIAFEGALKLKEISYVHAEGCGAGEMKHGPIAMIDENFPVVVIAPKDSVYEKIVSNIEEIKARRGKVIVITTEGNDALSSLADDVIFIPETLELLSPLLSVILLQLFAYYFAAARGHNVDRPRNLAKSVTVE